MTISSSTEAVDDVTEAAFEPESASNEMKKKELVDLVVIRSGIKKKDAKPVVEAMLAVLGESIAEGRELNLQPFGKLRINRTVEKHNGRVTVCKLRQSTNASNDTSTLAETAQDG
ncbi:HU family DNA-binding protein [Sedimentitalea todarodis]|uniref:HU family DNA-binding protein n=1 Tax=Sedimentitalea todarodis TaxID=1631240 RepID=A0ABU3VB91_9RHOB|nr:HU family DNA-binding protein [Sedimentitalea todarodis]MDU9003440.1 HU family DNA-binding protein [Sedimentitalea todarodis]